MKGENETQHVQGRWPKWPLTAHPPGHLVITAPLVITAGALPLGKGAGRHGAHALACSSLAPFTHLSAPQGPCL